MDNVYVLTLVKRVREDEQIIGVFAAEGLAEAARKTVEAGFTAEQRVALRWYVRLTAYQMGKLYPVD
jgi:hypothetical protein